MGDLLSLVLTGGRIVMVTASVIAIGYLSKPEAIEYRKGQLEQWWHQTLNQSLNDSNESSQSSTSQPNNNSDKSDDWAF
mgnify:CR=1 FL=1